MSHDHAAISATYRSIKTMVDGTPRVTIDLDCTLEVAAKVLGLPGDVVAIARLTERSAAGTTQPPGDVTVSRASAQAKEIRGEYGEQAKALKLSSFFRTRHVWQAIGTDDDFAKWIQRQKCCICGGGDLVESTGEMLCEAAHVRRAGESGVAYKGDYARVPMCHEHHAAQHRGGQSAVFLQREHYAAGRHGVASVGLSQDADDWFDLKRIEYVQQWAWDALKAKLGYESWRQVPPKTLQHWAMEQGVDNYLPEAYLC